LFDLQKFWTGYAIATLLPFTRVEIVHAAITARKLTTRLGDARGDQRKSRHSDIGGGKQVLLDNAVDAVI